MILKNGGYHIIGPWGWLETVCRDSFRDSRLYGSMMNCVNALEQQLPPPPPPAPVDEKHDSRKYHALRHRNHVTMLPKVVLVVSFGKQTLHEVSHQSHFRNVLMFVAVWVTFSNLVQINDSQN